VSRQMFSGAEAVAPGKVQYFETQDDLLLALPALVQKGDVILVKASRGMYLEKTVEQLLV